MRLLNLLALVPLALARRQEVRLLQADAAPQSFINTAVARTVELGGSTTQVTTKYNVKALSDSSGEYVLALGAAGAAPPAWFEVLVDGKPAVGVTAGVLEGAPVAIVPVGDLKKDAGITVSLSSITTRDSRPVPDAIHQREPQYMVWETNSTLVDSIYTSEVERIKIRTPSPQIISHGQVPSTYTRDSDVTVSAATVTLGPFHSVPPTVGPAASAQQSAFYVHYETREPVIGIRSLRRTAEVSHWGANLNIQDEVALFNDGPALKGQFSRLAHQQSKYHATKPAQVLSEFTLRIPPSAHSVYYYDTIGNVSTSHFRAGVPAPPGKRVRTARVVDGVLELKPRYPILGGWNYTFVVGWDSPLGDALKISPEGKHVLAVPFLTAQKGVVVDEEEFSVILPEGASDIKVYTPFPVDSQTVSTHKTYLDTQGRPVVTLQKSDVTENHAQAVYIEYSISPAAQFRKPVAVAVVALTLLFSFILLRRVNYNIDRKPKRI